MPPKQDADSFHLETERLILRSFRLSDLDPFVAYRAEPRVARFQSWTHFTHAQGRTFLQEQAATQPDCPGTWFQIALTLRDSDLLIGDLAWHTPSDMPEVAELGFTLAPPFQGKGYAAEAATCLIRYLFEHAAKERIIAVTDAHNASSIKLLQTLGFSEDLGARTREPFKGGGCTLRTYILMPPTARR